MYSPFTFAATKLLLYLFKINPNPTIKIDKKVNLKIQDEKIPVPLLVLSVADAFSGFAISIEALELGKTSAIFLLEELPVCFFSSLLCVLIIFITRPY